MRISTFAFSWKMGLLRTLHRDIFYLAKYKILNQNLSDGIVLLLNINAHCKTLTIIYSWWLGSYLRCIFASEIL